MGYVLSKGKANVIKIDGGYALPFLQDMSSSKEMIHSPETRDMLVGTKGTKISFESLTSSDKEEFIKATKDILSAKDE